MKPILIKLDKNDNLPQHDPEAWDRDDRYDLWCFLMKGYLFKPCSGYGGPKAIKKCTNVKIKRGQPKPILMEIEYWESDGAGADGAYDIPSYWKETRLSCSIHCPYCNRVPGKTREMINSMSRETP